MSARPPALIAIDHDDHHARHVGHTADGRQFFLTNPFEWTHGGRPGAEFVAPFLFDAAGQLLDAVIDHFGPRATMDRQRSSDVRDQRLRELGNVTFDRIVIAPFAVERFVTTFGLAPRRASDGWWVDLVPGDSMAFHEPWDGGEYDT